MRHDVDGREELYSLVKGAGAFVFPSEREGFGIAALEALACGVPAVTTAAPDNLARHPVGRSGGRVREAAPCAPQAGRRAGGPGGSGGQPRRPPRPPTRPGSPSSTGTP